MSDSPILRTFTAESVTEGHPDKVADYIADSILDAHLEGDRESRVAIEVLCKSDQVVLAGEITSRHLVDYVDVVRAAVREIGYTDPAEPFNADAVEVVQMLTPQSSQIGKAVDGASSATHELGAGDQGIMVGYATAETPQLMPLPLVLAHGLSYGLAEDRKMGAVPWLRPDGKTQVSVRYEGDEPVAVTRVIVSTQYAEGTPREGLDSYVRDSLAPRVLGEWYGPEIELIVNPSGEFTLGGPSADSGLSGRKVIVDTYGPLARHGGGSFSGKDPTKVDRSAAYFCRFVARQLVRNGLAGRAEVHVAYAIGRSDPVALAVETFGTGDAATATEFVRSFDFRPAAIIERLDLRRPIYRRTTNYGHFGRPGLPWEA
ncbi:MAG: S-adenosylmethionine synthetase [Gemmatimonas sp. SM23_52]|nr:MAG: S-adenosylmethionine synthetase [Gemmatimonas sp. SM23_52]